MHEQCSMRDSCFYNFLKRTCLSSKLTAMFYYPMSRKWHIIKRSRIWQFWQMASFINILSRNLESWRRACEWRVQVSANGRGYPLIRFRQQPNPSFGSHLSNISVDNTNSLRLNTMTETANIFRAVACWGGGGGKGGQVQTHLPDKIPRLRACIFIIETISLSCILHHSNLQYIFRSDIPRRSNE